LTGEIDRYLRVEELSLFSEDAIGMGLGAWFKYGKLQSDDPRKRAAAVTQLIHAPDPGAIEPLCALLHDEQRAIRAAAAQALGAAGAKQAVGALIQALLGEKQWEVRYEIVEALRKIGDPTAVNELMLVIERGSSDTSLQQVATWALKEFGWEHLTAEQQAMVSILRDDWSQAAKCGAAAIQPLLAAMRTGTHRVRLDAAETLVKMNEPRALALLIDLCKDKDPDLRAVAAQMLERHAWGKLNEAQQAVVAVLLGKWKVVLGLGEAALEPLAEVLRSGNRQDRPHALETLAALGGEQAGRLVIKAAKDTDPSVRIQAVRLLATMTLPEAAEALGAALDDRDPQVRAAAAEALARAGRGVNDPAGLVRLAVASGRWGEVIALGAAAVPAILECVAQGGARAQALAALVEIGPPAVPAVLELAGSAEPSNRAAAAEALGELRDNRVQSALEKLTEDPDPAVRMAAFASLRKLGWEPRDPAQAARVAIALNDWSIVPQLGVAAMPALMELIADVERALKALGAIEQIVQRSGGDVASEDLTTLAALSSAPAPSGGRAALLALGGRSLQTTVARRRVAQLARAELQRRGR
jgi:HEAT repeat protein